MNTCSESPFHLFVVSHKDIWIPSSECLIPLKSTREDGVNISSKRNYCELRAQYWVWKNLEFTNGDYVGFFHYRRYLNLNKKRATSPLSREKRPLPYRIRKAPDPQRYDIHTVASAIAGFDVIAPVWEHTGMTVWKRYSQSSGHNIADLELVYQIISEKYSEYLPAANTYLNGSGEYYGNIYIMRWPMFQNYCRWLFDILHEFDLRVQAASNYVNGFLGERLFGVYFTWLQAQNDVSCGEYPRDHFSCYDDENHRMQRNAWFNLLFPPGSLRRIQIRRIFLKFRGAFHV